ncbi:MAG: hypothetical protein AAFO69_09195, partial [Bacteroidota bacterium]
MSYKVQSNEPIAITWFGDPHVDDNGCNWPLLKRDCDIVANTPGMYGANIGDSHNNWVGRLVKKYIDQEATLNEAYQMIDWLFHESGVNWLLILLGNHDEWNDGARILNGMNAYNVPMVDWRAQFQLEFPNGMNCKIDAAHDHKGHSQWNKLHGQGKAALMGGQAHLYVAGHRHCWALGQDECPDSGRVYWLARCRGYKYIDDYADRLGFPNQEFGASIVSVIDPNAETPTEFITCFADVQQGADYLQWRRKKNGY